MNFDWLFFVGIISAIGAIYYTYTQDAHYVAMFGTLLVMSVVLDMAILIRKDIRKLLFEIKKVKA